MMKEHEGRPKHSRCFGRILGFAYGAAWVVALLIALPIRSSSLGLLQTLWDFEPVGWVRTNDVTCRVEVTDPVGFYDIAEYRYSTTGEGDIGAQEWISDNLSIGGTLSTTKIITVTNLNLPDALARNFVQFRCKALDEGYRQSIAYPVLVDATPPENPVVTSTTHITGAWSSNNTIEMTWSGASDATSRVFGYSYLFDNSPATLPDEVLEQKLEPPVSSGALVDSDSYYFHIRTRDNAGNWTAAAVHSGPYRIDTTRPENPTSVSSPSHTIGEWSTNNVIQVSWNPGTDATSGIGGYSFAWDNITDTLPGPITNTLLGFSISPAMPDSDNIWFHLRTVDRAGNWESEAYHYGPFLVDTAPPWNPTSFDCSHITDTWSNEAIVTISWEGAGDAGSGLAGYSYVWDQQPDTIPEASIRTTDTISVSPEFAHSSSNWFHLRAVDHLGNWSETVHRGPFLIDTEAPTSPSILSVVPAGWTNLDSFAVQWEANPPDPSGIGGAYYKLDSPPLNNSDYYTYTRGNDIRAISNISVGTDGLHIIYVWLEDTAGNSDYRTAVSPFNPFRLDRAAPVSDYALGRDPDCGGWYTSTVEVCLSADDTVPPEANAVSQVAVISYTVDGGPLLSLSETCFAVSGEGEHTIRYFATDNAGNREITHTVAPPIKIDLKPPISTVSDVTGVPGTLGWWVSPVQVVLSAADQASGVAEIWYSYQRDDLPWTEWAQGATFTLSQGGRYRVRHYAVDRACHAEQPQDMAGTINIDLLPPSTTYTLEGTLGQNGWYTASPVSITLWPTDPMSGIRETKYRVDGGPGWRVWADTPITLVGDGVYTVEYYSADNAGNRESEHLVQVGVDSAAPALVGLPEISPSGWHNGTDFTLSWTNPPQETSGVVGAFYKFTDEPQSNDDHDGQCVGTEIITHCTDIEPPGEGKYDIYVWLLDKAGNTDYRTRKYRPNGPWYDATPPRTEVSVSGTSQGLWYNSDVTLTFDATDPVPPGVAEVSGIKVTSYSLECGPTWQEGNQVIITEDGRKTVCFRSQDNADNVEGARRKTVRIDRTPPPTPGSITIAPSEWTQENHFTLSWENPNDNVSGVAGAYYSHHPPTSPGDGIFVSSSDSCFLGECSTEVSVPDEGVYDLYFWLKDWAGNSGWQNPLHVPSALRYDATPPTTTPDLTGSPGPGGWWVSPVTVHLTANDNISGVAETHYRLRQPPDQLWEPWQTYTGPLLLSRDGSTTVKYYSIDEAGNQETFHEFTVNVDMHPPHAQVMPLPPEIQSPTPNVAFNVSWDGFDPLPGAGLSGFNIQSKAGIASSWTPWLADTLQQNAVFEASPGQVYYFRAQATDAAGNTGGFSGSSLYGDARTYVQSVVNGNFVSEGFVAWDAGGPLWAREVMTYSHESHLTRMALLGQPELGRGVIITGSIGITPIGYGAITQTITIPPLEDLINPTLSFWYRVYTYDVVWSTGNLYDSFDVHILSATGQELELVLRDGNFGHFSQDMPVVDTGWKQGLFSLAPYAGQTIRIRFACHNRNDNYYNTWAYVDDIGVSGEFEYRTELPAIFRFSGP